MQGIHVSADYFPMFGAPSIAGRTFTAEKDSPNGGHVTVLSYGFWKSHYGADPKIVGSTIQLDGQPYLVVGVVGPGFVTDTPADLWVPFQFDVNSQDMVFFFRVAARLRTGVTVPQANAQLRLVADQFRRMYGNDSLPPNGGFGVVSLQQTMIGDTRPRLLVLLGAVAFVLLIACANVANLLLARAAARKREFATRAALGAGRGQIIRQLLVESLTLSLAGGLIGLGAGFAGVRFILRINPGDITRGGAASSSWCTSLNFSSASGGHGVLVRYARSLMAREDSSQLSVRAQLYTNRRMKVHRGSSVRFVWHSLEVSAKIHDWK